MDNSDSQRTQRHMKAVWTICNLKERDSKNERLCDLVFIVHLKRAVQKIQVVHERHISSYSTRESVHIQLDKTKMALKPGKDGTRMYSIVIGVSNDIGGQFKGHNFVQSRLILRLIRVTWKL